LPSPTQRADTTRAKTLLVHIDELRAGEGSTPSPAIVAALPPEVPNDPIFDRRPRRARAYIAAGGSLLGLSVAAAGLAGFAVLRVREAEEAYLDAHSMAYLERARFQGMIASRGMIASATLAAMMSTVGATVLTVGLVM